MTAERAADAQRQMEARAREDGLTFVMSDLRERQHPRRAPVAAPRR